MPIVADSAPDPATREAQWVTETKHTNRSRKHPLRIPQGRVIALFSAEWRMRLGRSEVMMQIWNPFCITVSPAKPGARCSAVSKSAIDVFEATIHAQRFIL